MEKIKFPLSFACYNCIFPIAIPKDSMQKITMFKNEISRDQCNGLANKCSTSRHSIWAPICLPAASLPIQLINWEAAELGSSPWATVPTWETWRKLLAPDFGSGQLCPLQRLGSESEERRTFILSLLLFVNLPNKNK